MPKKRLWEVEHPYYCNEGNYFTSEEVGAYHKSWQDFVKEDGDADPSYNLVFRWDWEEWDEEEGEDCACNFTGDENYRNGRLLIFWMGQRKGIYRYSVVEVCRADEPKIRKWLTERWKHMCKLWEPFE